MRSWEGKQVQKKTSTLELRDKMVQMLSNNLENTLMGMSWRISDAGESQVVPRTQRALWMRS